MIAAAGADDPQPAMTAPNILVVEDEVLIRFVITDVLRSEGFNVLEAATAAEAITILESSTDVALVFTDVRMPGPLDGLDVVRFVRANLPETKVLITSALEVAPEIGEFVAKPYVPQAIGTRIRKMLRAEDHFGTVT
jgi:CheY-like chemotaxis protein